MQSATHAFLAELRTQESTSSFLHTVEGALAAALTAASLSPRKDSRVVCLEQGLDVLAYLRDSNLPSLAVYRLLVAAAGREKRTNLALKLFTELCRAGLQPDLRTTSALTSNLSAAPACTLPAYEALCAASAPLDVAALNQLLGCAAAPEAGPPELRAALVQRLLLDLAARGLRADEGTLAAAVAALGSAGRVDDAFQAWTDLCAAGVRPWKRAWAALLGACRAAGQHDRCDSHFRAMRDAGEVPVNRFHWNIAVDCAVRAGQYPRAFALQTEMAAAGLPPDRVTRNTLLAATAALHGIDAAFACVASRPSDVVAWTILVDLCAEAGDAPRAAQALISMRAAGVQPDVVTFTALIKAHAACNDPAAAMAAYREMRAAGLRPNASTFLTLLRACRSAGDLTRASEVYSEMRHCGLRPNNALFRGMLSSWADLAASQGGSAALPGWLLEAAAAQHGRASVDLHGLSSAEARAAVLCTLRSLRDDHAAAPPGGLLIITGRGRNSARGVAVLRDEVARLCSELRLPCVAEAENPGRVRVPAEALSTWLSRGVLPELEERE